MSLVETVAKALCAASSEEWRDGTGYVDFDAQDRLNNHWRFKAKAAVTAVMDYLRSEYDTANFDDWSDESLIGQCRMQAHDNLDPEYCQFMHTLANRLSALKEQTQ